MPGATTSGSSSRRTPERVEPAGPGPADRVEAQLERVVVVADAQAPGQPGGDPVRLVQGVAGLGMPLLQHQQPGQRRGGAVGAALGRGGSADARRPDAPALASLYMPAGSSGAPCVVGHQQRARGAVDRQRIDPVAGNVFIDDAQILTTDILTSNGIIHVIDQVILPA